MALSIAYVSIMDLESARKHFEVLKKLDPGLAKRLEDTPTGVMILRRVRLYECNIYLQI
jgi:hypothetical protein